MAGLLEFAAHQFKLGKPGKDGKPLGETLQTVERMTGRRPAELDGPDQPEGTEHIWHWFLELNRRREQAGAPITHIAMAAFFGLYGITPDAWELHAIEALDDLLLKEFHGS